MEVSYFFTMYNLEQRPYSDVLDGALKQVQLAEEGGFHTVWMAEHHFGGEGWDISPNPVQLGTFLAARTSRLRIGLAAVILPEWHPLRAAEDIALLDQLSRGRVECGIGRGITNRELSNLSWLGADRRDDQRNMEVFLESLEVIRAAWTTDSLRFRGKYFEYPAPGIPDSYAGWYPRDPRWRDSDGTYAGIDVLPKPYQKPHPRLWNVVDSTASFAPAANRSLNVLTWLRSWNALREAADLYQAEWNRSHDVPRRLGEGFGVMRSCIVAPTLSEAREIARPAIEAMYRDYLAGLRSRALYAEPGEEQSLGTPDDWLEFLEARGHMLVGTWRSVLEGILKLDDHVSPDQLLLFCWLPHMSADHVLRSLNLVAEHVLPELRSGSKLGVASPSAPGE